MQAIEFEPVVGLEVHVQLLTRSKMFCSCSAAYVDAPPNTHVCPVCLGIPGVLPVINRKAVEYTIMTALALNCEIPEHTKFDRKNYPYPDLMKGYQISQYDQPLSRKGWLDIEVDGRSRKVGITRVHLEEDTAKLFHRTSPEGETYSLVDVNRSGVPLMEIVSEPDMRSPEEARQYLVKLHTILQYIGVSTANMEEGNFRCDANVSIRPKGSTQLFTKVEVKNMNSFRAVYRALQYEVERQSMVWREGGRIVQETRGWVEERGVTVSQRSKEQAHDYRYFPEPDLPVLTASRQWVEEIRGKLPELPNARRDRFISQYALPLYDANLLTSSKPMADFFEEAVRGWKTEGVPIETKAKVTSNWMLTELNRLLNASGLEIQKAKITPTAVAELLDLMEKGTINGSAAKTVFEEMFNTGKRAEAIVKEKGLTQISDTEAIKAAVEQVVAANPQAVADYNNGKQQAIAFLVGQVMKATRGRANPGVVNALLREKLG